MEETKIHYAKSIREQLNIRVILLGALGSAIISMSSVYVALRLGALPWPTIFVAILSMALLKLLKNTNVNEINVAHTGMSAGSMVAGGLAFTLPGIWMIEKDASVSFWYVLAIAVSGVILGVVAVMLMREYFIERSNLPYPIGVAASDTVLSGDTGGIKAKYLFYSLGASAIFTALRDAFNKIPQAIISKTLYSKNFPLGFWLSPMAFGIGYIIGPIFMGVWFLGSILGNFILVPAGVYLKWFSSVDNANLFRSSLGIGMIVGGGVAILIKDILPKAKEIFGYSFKTAGKGLLRIIAIAVALVLAVITFYLKLNIVISIIVILGAWVSVSMASYIDGATGIDPLEIFGIIVLLIARSVATLFSPLTTLMMFAVAGIVAVASGLAGDNMQDFKAGQILKTDPKAQIISETVGGLVGAFTAALALFVLHSVYKEFGPGTQMPAPQAFAVAGMVKGLPFKEAFFIGLGAGVILAFFKFPSAIFGIGIYLPFIITGTAFLGAVARIIVKRFFPKFEEKGSLMSSGFLGGEGVTGVLIAIVRFVFRI